MAAVKNRPKRNGIRIILNSIKEIVFIAIGILIAFNINLWDTNRKKIRSADNFIRDINFNLKVDTSVFGERIRYIKILNQYQENVLQNKDIDTLTAHQLFSVIHGSYHNIKMYDESFTRMKSSDVFDLKKYDTLFKKINIYYSFYGTYLGNRNDWEREMYNNTSRFFILQNKFEISYNDSTPVIQNEVTRKKALLGILNSIEGRNQLKTVIARENGMMEVYELTFESATRLIHLTDSVINKMN